MNLFDNIPHHECICSYHENVRLLLVALKEHTAFALEFRRFIDQITCNSYNKKCMSCECDKCKCVFDAFVPINPGPTLKCQHWQVSGWKRLK